VTRVLFGYNSPAHQAGNLFFNPIGDVGQHLEQRRHSFTVFHQSEEHTTLAPAHAVSAFVASSFWFIADAPARKATAGAS